MKYFIFAAVPVLILSKSAQVFCSQGHSLGQCKKVGHSETKMQIVAQQMFTFPGGVEVPPLRWTSLLPAAYASRRQDIVNKSAEDGSAATKFYEHFKRSHLDTEATCRDEGINFIPVICEADGGGWGPTAHKVWSELAKHKSVRSGEQTSIIVTRLLQSLGLILRRENALSILRRYQSSIGQDYSELLTASAACLTSGDLNHPV